MPARSIGTTAGTSHGTATSSSLPVNHRLGALGYLCHPAVAPGDLGTQDVAAALRWIGREIEGFGGDPQWVTLMGQSAGASTIGALIADPATRPLFCRAILQSGGFGRTPVSPAEGAARATSLARHLGFDLAAPDGPARLRAAPVADILAAQGAVAREIAAFGDTAPPFPPVVASDLDVAGRLQRIAAGAVGLDLLVGTTRDEAHAFFAGDGRIEAATPAQVGAAAAALTGKPDALAAYRSARPGASWGEALADLTTDAVYRRPVLQIATSAAAAGARVFTYRFDGRHRHRRSKPAIASTFPSFSHIRRLRRCADAGRRRPRRNGGAIAVDAPEFGCLRALRRPRHRRPAALGALYGDSAHVDALRPQGRAGDRD